ncbi:MAG TPA: hypothetical protein PKE47_06205 [Verrucomicrobiota bacterium]|nr:hypothetical protein [Verrucomicrobiota bacterium]
MNLSAVANRAPLLLTVFLATGAMLFKAIAAEVPAPRLAWQVSPDELRLLPPWRDDQGVRLAWHDPTGIRAVVESSTDLRLWFHEEGIYRPGLTSYVFYPVRPALWSRRGTPPWETPFGLFYRLRRVPVLREGRVYLGNRVISEGVNAPVTFLGDMRPGSPNGGERLADGQFLGQFMVEVPGLYRGPVGEALPFRGGTLAGSIPAMQVAVPMSEGTDEVTVTMVAWAVELGASFYEATSRGTGLIGQSDPVNVRPATNPFAPPAMLVGLRPFSIAPIL